MAEKGTKFKVKYTGGSSMTLARPLQDGRSVFKAGIVYTIDNAKDFLRLAQSGKFEAVEIDETLFDAERFKLGEITRKKLKEEELVNAKIAAKEKKEAIDATESLVARIETKEEK